MSLSPGDHHHDFAFRGMGLVMCEELAGGAAAELLKFFCQLSGDAKLPIRHHIRAGGESFGESLRRLKKNDGLIAFPCCSQLALALPTFNRKKSAKRKFVCRESGTKKCGQN